MEEMVREVVAEEQESTLGATSIEKIPKISASCQNFLDTLFEKGPYQRKCQYFIPKNNYKNSSPPPYFIRFTDFIK